MGRNCCVPKCKTNSTPKANEDPKRFSRPCFRFPVDDELYKIWLERIPRKDAFNTKHSGVCILHFESDLIKMNNQRYTLVKDAVPTIFESDPLMESKTETVVHPSQSTSLQAVTRNNMRDIFTVNERELNQNINNHQNGNYAYFNPETDICDFDYFQSHLTDKLKLNDWMISLSGQSILIFNLNKQSTGMTKGEMSIRSTISIDSNLAMKVFVKGVVIFNGKISKWTEIQKFLDAFQIKIDVAGDMGFELNNVMVVGRNNDYDIKLKSITIGSSQPEENFLEMHNFPTSLQQEHSLQQQQGPQHNLIPELNCVIKTEPQTVYPEFEGYFFNEQQVKREVNVNVANNVPNIGLIDDTTNYTCAECGKKFDHHIRYMLHIRRHDPKECSVCPICNKNVYGRMTRHLNSHKETNFVCNIDDCKRVFRKKESLKEHARSVHSPGEFYCDICNDGENIRTKAKLRSHMRRHLNGTMSRGFPDLENKQIEWLLTKQMAKQKKNDSLSKNLSNLCNVCGKGFSSAKQLQLHSRRHDESRWKECPVCKKRFPDGLSRHMKTHTKVKDNVCDICGMAYSQAYSLKIHKETSHFADKEFFCDICKNGFIYRSREHLRSHLKAHVVKGDAHIEENGSVVKYVQSVQKARTTYSCIQCEATFPSTVRLRDHATKVHTDEKEFHCLKCNETFDKSLLNSHEKFHDSNRVFQCHQCDKTFRLASYLRKHLHCHKGEERKRRVCQICYKKYVHNTDLRLHMKKIHGIDQKPKQSHNMLKSIET